MSRAEARKGLAEHPSGLKTDRLRD